MKKLIIGGIIMYSSLLVIGYAEMIVPSSENYILTEDDQQVLNTQDINDPIRDGAYNIGSQAGIAGGDKKISDHQVAQNKVLNVIKSIINYALGMIALVALVYLIYHGFLILTAAGDDAQYKKGVGAVKYAAIALGGVGLSRLIVSAIFRLITLIIGK